MCKRRGRCLISGLCCTLPPPAHKMYTITTISYTYIGMQSHTHTHTHTDTDTDTDTHTHPHTHTHKHTHTHTHTHTDTHTHSEKCHSLLVLLCSVSAWCLFPQLSLLIEERTSVCSHISHTHS